MKSLKLVAGALVALVASDPTRAAEGGGSALIQPEIGTAFWTLITFAIFAFVLGRFAWKPLLAALDQREKSIRGSIDQAKRDRLEAEAFVAEQRGLLEQARRERAEALAAGQRDAERLKEDILGQAREQREQLLRQTQAQIEAGMRQARADLRHVAVDIAIEAAGKLLSRDLDDATHRRLIEEYLTDLDRSPGSDSLPS